MHRKLRCRPDTGKREADGWGGAPRRPPSPGALGLDKIPAALPPGHRSAMCLPTTGSCTAEEYYPRYGAAQTQLRHPDDERAFHAASLHEIQEIMYAGLTSVETVKSFDGRILPTAPTTVILFPTFKRLRTAAILAELEVNRKVFMIGVPVRSDLKWRERALRVINHDLIDEDTDIIVPIETLSPTACYNKLYDLLQKGIASPRGNIIICPHGSKMQTVGVWKFCVDNPDARVALAHPKEFFVKKYSVGHRDTFVFDSAVAWNDLPGNSFVNRRP